MKLYSQLAKKDTAHNGIAKSRATQYDEADREIVNHKHHSTSRMPSPAFSNTLTVVRHTRRHPYRSDRIESKQLK